jgi:hypothetical protein
MGPCADCGSVRPGDVITADADGHGWSAPRPGGHPMTRPGPDSDLRDTSAARAVQAYWAYGLPDAAAREQWLDQVRRHHRLASPPGPG